MEECRDDAFIDVVVASFDHLRNLVDSIEGRIAILIVTEERFYTCSRFRKIAVNGTLPKLCNQNLQDVTSEIEMGHRVQQSTRARYSYTGETRFRLWRTWLAGSSVLF